MVFDFSLLGANTKYNKNIKLTNGIKTTNVRNLLLPISFSLLHIIAKTIGIRGIKKGGAT